MSRVRVLLISPVSDFKGGAEVVLKSMLGNPLIDPVLAVPEAGAISEAATAMGLPVCFYHPSAMLHVHRPPRPGPIAAAAFDSVRCAVRLWRLAVKNRCEVIHSNGLKAHMLLALLGVLTRTRTLVHLHDIPYRRSERAIWRAIAHRVDQVIMVSRPCYPDPVLPKNVEVIRNGIHMVASSLPEVTRTGPLRLGFVGRFHPNKGLDLLIDWFVAVRAAGLDATLTIRGRPDPDMPEYWSSIQTRIHDLGLTPWVLQEGWTTGAATYANLDVLLITSQVPDPAPLVVAEAMSAGVIVAGYPMGGIPEMIESGSTGLLVRDGAELATALSGLLASEHGIEDMRHAAYKAVTETFSMEAFHQRLADVYTDVLKRTPRRRKGSRTPLNAAVSNVPLH